MPAPTRLHMLPNELYQDKTEYVKSLLVDKDSNVVADCLNAAFIFYHCEVPLDNAHRYVHTLAQKLLTNRNG